MACANHRSIAIFALSSVLFAVISLPNADAQTVPPIPKVISVTPLGTVTQNPVIYGRDGTFSALVDGKSVWTFGDTPMSVPGVLGNYWDDNSLSWTTDLDASHGINLNHDLLDKTGAPAEFLPYLPWERKYNYEHDNNHCTVSPCGAEFAMWDGPVINDLARNRVLLFYYELYRGVKGMTGWDSVGTGIAVYTPGQGITRPIENPDSKTPTLMWGPKDQAYNAGSLVLDDTLYSYGCVGAFLVDNCMVAKVPLADALDIFQWTYYAGNNTWSTKPGDAVTIFQGGAAANQVFYNPYLGEYMNIYNPALNNDMYFIVSSTPWGPWSAPTLLFKGEKPYSGSVNYTGQAHVEFAQGNGQTQYVTYAHPTGFLREDLPLVQVVFGK
ncbi:MAG: DUF4185 domain-containing protein [Candidatus Sulfotelmatobacter sp.]